MQQFEIDYAKLVDEVLTDGHYKQTRNGCTYSVFGRSITIQVGNNFPVIQGRKMYMRGVFGEFAALLRKPQHVEHFERWGCNYWEKWSDSMGFLNVDYGNAWFDFNGFDQIAELKRCLREEPNSRRMIVSGWRPDKLAELSLPCCHYSYQFYVAADTLHMIWTQRSVDLMVGAPSDFILAALWLIMLANEFGMTPGTIKVDFGDCHVYEEHVDNARLYVNKVLNSGLSAPVSYKLHVLPGRAFETFEPWHLEVVDYVHHEPLQFLLKE